MPECHCWVPARCRQVRRPMIPSLRHAGASWFAVIAPFVRNVFTSSSRRRRDVSSPHQHDIVTSVRDAFSSLCRDEMLSVHGAFPLFVKICVVRPWRFPPLVKNRCHSFVILSFFVEIDVAVRPCIGVLLIFINIKQEWCRL
ncbi:hypothetical protein DAI22_02g300500 [Oryza sativa Japonica Group]|uniref:cDNA clone:J013163B17, full insert sequence n=1 Tax=Oryza sativa subsp. japonica TaxID=39947 RepID=B7EPY1_ORYSJ|nr:hypothetical protein DAI22_02g300500 [Oryza sativa Japonica Group]BAG94428.1 unnamed protein product [Oryza sativa Japonica Group]